MQVVQFRSSFRYLSLIEKLVLGLLGEILDPLGPSWGGLGQLRALLGAVLGPLSPSWGGLGRPLGRLRAILGPLGVLLGPPGWSWEAPGVVLGGSWGALGRSEIDQKIDPKIDPEIEPDLKRPKWLRSYACSGFRAR